MTEVSRPLTTSSMDRALIAIIYGLIMFSLFFAFIPAVIGVILAYARKADADPMEQSHYAFQTFIFWIAAGLAAVAFVCVIVAIFLMFPNLSAIRTDPTQDLTDFVPSLPAIGLLLVTMLAMIAAFVWMFVGPIFGVVRLAAGRGIGQSVVS